MANLRSFIFGCALVSCFSLTAAAQRSTPEQAVRSFYSFDKAHSQVFNRRNIDARKAWFSTQLYSLFQIELRREAAYLKKNPTDKPYFGDGLPFQPYDEVCKAGTREFRRGVTVKKEFQRGSRAAATATFSYPRACRDGGDPVVYTIGLVKSRGQWVIDDVNYGEDTTLKERLKRKEY